MNNLFFSQPEFVLSDPAHEYKTSGGVLVHDQKNLYTRYESWEVSSKLAGKSVLDIGSKVSSAGAYCLNSGASRYVGVEKNQNFIDIATVNLKKYYKGFDVSLICQDAEEFINACTEKFDIVFVGRTLHQISNGIDFLKKIGSISNKIVIEDVHPPHLMIHEMTKKFNDKDLLEKIVKELEYNYPVLETHPFEIMNYLGEYPFTNTSELISNNDSGSMYSMGLLKNIFVPLGFVPDLSSYEQMKLLFPEEYGFGLYNKKDGIKKYIIRFQKNV